MHLALCQFNPTVGDLCGNIQKLLAFASEAKQQGADLLVGPELALCGYPPRDLLEQPGFVAENHHALHSLIKRAPLPMLVGALVPASAPSAADPLLTTGHLANGAVLFANGATLACHRKNLLPTYDVFDEARYFTAGSTAAVSRFGGIRLGLSICEDIWNDSSFWKAPRYSHDPVARCCAAGAELLVNLSASPFEHGRGAFRQELLAATAKRHRRPIVYVNQVGGNDALLFDGRSQVVDATGEQVCELAAFAEDMAVVELLPGEANGELRLKAPPSRPKKKVSAAPRQADVVGALCMGLADYVRKSGFKKVVLGLSGGIDSAVVATLAVQALGASQVIGVALPSIYSSAGSLEDAYALAAALQIRCDTLPIKSPVSASMQTLEAAFGAEPKGLTAENIQARMRGLLLMAYANHFGALCLTTGNKSEIAVGYTTLYGDMCGALAPIGDLYKTEVYALATYLNETLGGPIPHSTLHKPPSAELRPEQRDDDSLPPYPELDPMLRAILEQGQTAEQLVRGGQSSQKVERVLQLVRNSEYKRRQMAPCLRVSGKAFGEGRRLPIAMVYPSAPGAPSLPPTPASAPKPPQKSSPETPPG
jgi:NAD+ synthase (glutamine-hydrolysing)